MLLPPCTPHRDRVYLHRATSHSVLHDERVSDQGISTVDREGSARCKDNRPLEPAIRARRRARLCLRWCETLSILLPTLHPDHQRDVAFGISSPAQLSAVFLAETFFSELILSSADFRVALHSSEHESGPQRAFTVGFAFENLSPMNAHNGVHRYRNSTATIIKLTMDYLKSAS